MGPTGGKRWSVLFAVDDKAVLRGKRVQWGGNRGRTSGPVGKRVRTLVREEKQGAGLHRLKWTGESGVYFYRIRAEGFTATRKMVLVR